MFALTERRLFRKALITQHGGDNVTVHWMVEQNRNNINILAKS